MPRPWWEDAVFYQIYPRSFRDSNGDGVGDLAGIAEKLDYLAWLGIDALWISPFFPSPMKDFGYDVADYRGVDPMFGTLDDFERLAAGAKARGIRIVLDLVANHSSDQHPWFVEARSSRLSPKHDWYLWTKDEGKPPNNWKAIFELSSAWFPNPATGERYLGTFTRWQPEFDWRNPEVRRAFYDIMRFWFGLGVDGFRLDVATAYLKDAQLRSNPFSWNANPDFFQKHLYDRNRPEVHEIFAEMRKVADEVPGVGKSPSLPGERVLIGETHGQDAELAASCHGGRADELHMAFNFDFLNQKWKAEAFRASAERWYSLMPIGAWPNFTLSNHDRPRHIWRYRARDPENTEARAKAAAAMLLTLRGTPFLYYGEEIGMGCFRLPKEALRDPLGVKTWPLGFLGRDPERTPMQWDSSPGAGFSAGKPWLPLNPDWRERSVEAQRGRPSSLLEWYRSLIALRRAMPALRRGSLRWTPAPRDVLAFERGDEETGERFAVLLNFSSRAGRATLSGDAAVLLGTAREAGQTLAAGACALGPNEVLIARLQR